MFSEELYTAAGESGLGSFCIVSEELLEIRQGLKRSLVILMSDSVFACGCPNKSFGHLTVIVGSGVRAKCIVLRWCVLNVLY